MSENDLTGQDDSPNFRRLREKVERLEAENKQLRTTNVELLAEVSGIDPTHKLTALALERFLGQEDVELSKDAFKAFAEEYQLPTKPDATDGGDGGGAGDASAAFDALQQGADQLRQATTQVDGEPTRQEQIRAAEASGDFETARALKTQAIRDQIVSSLS